MYNRVPQIRPIAAARTVSISSNIIAGNYLLYVVHSQHFFYLYLLRNSVSAITIFSINNSWNNGFHLDFVFTIP